MHWRIHSGSLGARKAASGRFVDMKQILPALLLLVFLAGTSMAQDKPKKEEPARTGKVYVQVYLKENFMGQAYRIPVPTEVMNDAQLKTYGIPNDSIASMKIPDGVVVTLYDGAGLKGASQSFTGKVPNVDKMKGLTSSVKTELKGKETK